MRFLRCFKTIGIDHGYTRRQTRDAANWPTGARQAVSYRKRLLNWQDRRGFDLDTRVGFDESLHDQHGHRRVVFAHYLAVCFPYGTTRFDIRSAIGDEPGEPNEMLGLSTCGEEHRDNVTQRLRGLGGEISADNRAVSRVPTDLAGDQRTRPLALMPLE